MNGWFNCANLAVVAIHAYGTGDFVTATIRTYVNKATASRKKLLFQEWGACSFDTSNKTCPSGNALPAGSRNNNIHTWARQSTAAGVPWLY
ncbi:hypothetical protein OF83DRAFT_1167232 [Amylostereum chailletii]|nr:hypothetical protein OF83DRAFT_1167232 [Amylostereum chailletii]